MPCPSLPVPPKSLGYTRVAELILDEAMSPTMRPRFYVRLVIDRSVCYSLSWSRHRQDRIGENINVCRSDLVRTSAPTHRRLDALSFLFSAGASLAARSLKYVRLSEAILDEQLGPERIAAVFKLSACKTAKADCAFVLLAGSVAKYRSAPSAWSAKPEAAICRALVGDDFRRVSDEAAKFVRENGLRIVELVGGDAAAA